MYPLQRYLRIPIQLAPLLGVVLVSGCAGLPRIDPTGERVFVWPQNQPVAAAPGIGAVQAPPVLTDPVFPSPALSPTVGAPIPVGGAAPIVAPGVPVVEDRLSITPERILAPIGTEVILRAGICAREGFLLTDQKVEWLLAREGAGELVDLGGKGCLQNPLLPWNKPKKVDNQYGIGYTARWPLLITRGTANPADDVQIEPGHAWASITSPIEGISTVTAVTPTVVNWSARRATATIYWIDTQWTFPPPSISAGGSQVLTTTVLRQSDGSPLTGWVVRYEVAGGGGSLSGNQSGQVVEVVTGADGKASIDVTPTASEGSATQINMQLVRPAGMGLPGYPRLVVANGSTTINWTGQSTPYLPDLDDPVGGQSTFQPPLQNSPPSSQPIRSQPPGQQSTGRPSLDVQVYGEDQTQTGARTRFEVVIRNNGDADATGIVLTDRYEQGLSHSPAGDRTMQIENNRIGNLRPGETRSVYLEFQVVGSGRLCHDVMVRSNEGAEASTRGCVNAVQAEPQGQPDLRIEKDGPRQVSVGDVALFSIVVRNTGELPLTNLVIVDEYDRSFSPQPRQQGYEIVNGNIQWRIPRLDVGESKKFEVQCSSLRPANRAGGIAKVTDDSGLMRVDDHYVEVLPGQDTGGVAPEGPPQQGGTLRLAIEPAADTLRAGQRTTIRFLIENQATAPEEQVVLSVIFPPELTPDINMMTNSANVRGAMEGNELRFDPIAQLRTGERLEFLVPANVNQAGVVNVGAQLTSRAVPQPVVKIQRVEILGR